MCRIYTDYTITPLSDDLDLSHMQRQKSNMENNIKNVLHHQICPGPWSCQGEYVKEIM